MENIDHPLARGRRRQRQHLERHLSRDDVGNQARVLLSRFIHDRLVDEGQGNVGPDQMIEPGTPAGPPVGDLQEVAVSLRRIGDELDQDVNLQHLISQISPDAPKQTFMNVAKEIFSDGVYNWGRIVALFYFAYKMVVKALKSSLNHMALIRSVIEWVVQFIVDYLAPWIIERGGWEAVQEYFGTPAGQTLAVMFAGFAVSAFYILWRNRGGFLSLSPS